MIILLIVLIIDLIFVADIVWMEFRFNKTRREIDNIYDLLFNVADTVGNLQSDFKDFKENPVFDEQSLEDKTRSEMEKMSERIMDEWKDKILNYNPYGR